MRGNITKRGKTYTIVLDIGRDDNGKRKQTTKGGFKTKKEAEKALSELIVKIEKGDYFVSENMLFKDYLEKWLNEYCINNLTPKTIKTYKQLINTYIAPRLGAIKLDKLKPLDLQSFYNYLQNDLKLSGTTALHCHEVINVSLKHAVQWQMLNRNIASSVQRPKKAKKEMLVLTAEQTNMLLERIKNLSLYIPVLLAVTTGLRRGEVLGLTWNNVDLDKGVIYIVNQLQRIDGEFKLVPTKTARSKRNIVLLDYTIPILRNIKKIQIEHKLLLGSEYKDHNLMYSQADGSPYDPEYISRHFLRTMTKLSVELEIPRIRFHDLRHTHATLLLSRNINPKIVSERLGHSSISITLDTYSHVLPDMQKEAAENLNDLMVSIHNH
ncbi:site-specific integrase [Clostridium estertheticum]|uniref:site-specific integrase n=1 Tax=Clostridium estertheticum TaxID=238834 RepID=UPI001C7DD431|nr:site-specific integrase [Clostridium estertheticum]MBX4271986.1 site-specific integrase [Clostridium estertheticum]WLC80745.1 site-specific integrase [Clostridium estertheticum]